VVRLKTNDIRPMFRELVQRGTVTEDVLRENTPWGTHEFGVFDLNRNLIFIIQDI
jgi:hypothetical protein